MVDRCLIRRAAAPRGNGLVAVEAERSHSTKRSCVPPPVIAAYRFCCVLHNRERKASGNFVQRIHIDRVAKDMNRQEGRHPGAGQPIAADTIADDSNIRQVPAKRIGIDAERIT